MATSARALPPDLTPGERHAGAAAGRLHRPLLARLRPCEPARDPAAVPSSPEDRLARAGERLGDIKCPALVMWATEDPYLGREFGDAYATSARQRAARGGRARRALALVRPPGLIDRAGFLAPPGEAPRRGGPRRSAALCAGGPRLCQVALAGVQQDPLAGCAHAHEHAAFQDLRERAVAAVRGQPLGAANGRAAVPCPACGSARRGPCPRASPGAGCGRRPARRAPAVEPAQECQHRHAALTRGLVDAEAAGPESAGLRASARQRRGDWILPCVRR